jgi:hypothetical protein
MGRSFKVLALLSAWFVFSFTSFAQEDSAAQNNLVSPPFSYYEMSGEWLLSQNGQIFQIDGSGHPTRLDITGYLVAANDVLGGLAVAQYNIDNETTDEYRIYAVNGTQFATGWMSSPIRWIEWLSAEVILFSSDNPENDSSYLLHACNIQTLECLETIVYGTSWNTKLFVVQETIILVRDWSNHVSIYTWTPWTTEDFAELEDSLEVESVPFMFETGTGIDIIAKEFDGRYHKYDAENVEGIATSFTDNLGENIWFISPETIYMSNTGRVVWTDDFTGRFELIWFGRDATWNCVTCIYNSIYNP